MGLDLMLRVPLFFPPSTVFASRPLKLFMDRSWRSSAHKKKRRVSEVGTLPSISKSTCHRQWRFILNLNMLFQIAYNYEVLKMMTLYLWCRCLAKRKRPWKLDLLACWVLLHACQVWSTIVEIGEDKKDDGYSLFFSFNNWDDATELNQVQNTLGCYTVFHKNIHGKIYRLEVASKLHQNYTRL